MLKANSLLKLGKEGAEPYITFSRLNKTKNTFFSTFFSCPSEALSIFFINFEWLNGLKIKEDLKVAWKSHKIN